MKKIYTLIAGVALVFSANAQTKGLSTSTHSEHASNSPVKILPLSNTSRATGDTLMYMPLLATYVNATDNPGFQLVIEDIDGLTTYNAGYDPDFGIYSSTDSSLNGVGGNMSSNWYLPWETPAPAGNDTAFFWHATSWFNPAGQADNWLEFGPLTIPAAGAKLQWYMRCNPWGIDGYSVKVSTTPSATLSFADFTDPAIWSIADAHPSPTAATDSVWTLKSVFLPSMYNGQVVSIAFNHTAFDMDVLYLDEILLTEQPMGVAEFVNGAKLFQSSPNPTNGVSTISYELEKNAQVALNVFDVTGKVVATENVGEQTSGNHNVRFSTDNLSAGVYYYSLTVNNATTAAMKMVVIK